MTERETDRAFGEWKKAGEPPENPDTVAAAQNDLLAVLTQHGYAVCWEVLGQRRLDVVNAALVRIMKSIGSFRGDAKFSTYAHRIFINECKRVAVKEGLQHKREVPLEDVPEPTAPDAQGEGEIDKVAIRGLSPNDYAFYVMKVNGHQDHLIAEAFHLSPAGVRVRWHRIRKKLQGLLHST